MNLSEQDVHVGYVFTDEFANEPAQARCRALLCPEELARGQRFLAEQHRRAFFSRRAFLRTWLSSCTGVGPTEWQFAFNSYGKPQIAAPREFTSLSFNLSHRSGICVCGLTLGQALGIDVEDVTQHVDLEVGKTVFSASELAHISRAPKAQRKEAFFKIWTLKEAYIKARGEGMSLPLPEISIDLDSASAPRVLLGPPLAGDSRQWHLRQFTIGSKYLAALAISGGDCRLNIHPAIPFDVAASGAGISRSGPLP